MLEKTLRSKKRSQRKKMTKRQRLIVMPKSPMRKRRTRLMSLQRRRRPKPSPILFGSGKPSIRSKLSG